MIEKKIPCQFFRFFQFIRFIDEKRLHTTQKAMITAPPFRMKKIAMRIHLAPQNFSVFILSDVALIKLFKKYNRIETRKFQC